MSADESPAKSRPPLRQRTKAWVLAAWRALAPSRTALLGAAAAMAIVSLGVWLSVVVEVTSPAAVAGPISVGAGIVLLAILIAGCIALLLAWLGRAPLIFRWTLLAATILLAFALLLVPVSPLSVLAIVGGVLLAASVLGGSLAVLASGKWRTSGRVTLAATFLFALIGIGALASSAWWLTDAGSPRKAIGNAALVAKGPASISLPDPSSRGSHTVKSLTYGSGSDRHRAEYADGATLRTQAVDASKVLKGWSGMTGWARTRYWGFDAKALPLNGRVWFPDGAGPFPLVLIVHGNHLAADFSDPGYEYLGQLLASRGYIFVSVDENFLNSMESDLFSGLDNENNTRGWLLLEHLRVWHQWNADEKSPFHGKVDTDHIALAGHSRGGEAAAHAAAFNRLPFNPDDARAKFNYGYKIRSVVAIAPAEGQYRPAGTRTPLVDVNYFTIQGSHDSDVDSFMGLCQYDRVRFSGEGDWFKSAVYVYAANHGQFNTSWGAYDVGAGIPRHIVDTRSLLGAADQRRILEVYLSAFLDCTLRDGPAYRALFEDWRNGARWLPPTIYLTQYADATMQPLCTFDEDIDLSTATAAGGKIAAQNLSRWREARPEMRATLNEDRAVTIGWDREREPAAASYEITWPAGTFALGDASVLTFALADANESPTPDDDQQSKPEKEKGADHDAPQEPIDLTIELTDAAGHTARLPLSHFSLLQPQLETRFLKAAVLQAESLSEPIFQTFRFPLADFRQANPQFDPASAVRLRLLFDRTKAGVVIFDKAAFGKSK